MLSKLKKSKCLFCAVAIYVFVKNLIKIRAGNNLPKILRSAKRLFKITENAFLNNLNGALKLQNKLTDTAVKILPKDKCYGKDYFNAIWLYCMAVCFGCDVSFCIGTPAKSELLKRIHSNNTVWVVINSKTFGKKISDQFPNVFTFNYSSKTNEIVTAYQKK